MLTANGNTFFTVGVDAFENLEVRRAKEDAPLFYFFDKQRNTLITHFVLDDSKPQTRLCCQVTLVQKGKKFTPRLELSKRRKIGKALVKEPADNRDKAQQISARVDLDDCHENFWELISFIQSFDSIDVPEAAFSLVGTDDAALIRQIRTGRDPASLMKIAKSLAQASGKGLSEADVSQLLNRKGKLEEFRNALTEHPDDESSWQNFFLENKWIFGYGLNYQILGIEQAQPNYGGTQIDGKREEKGDYLGATRGDIRFTAPVEIKPPSKPLLTGKEEIRSGAWSLSKDLTDAISQLQSNIHRWEQEGSQKPENRDTLEDAGIYTVRPRGILVIGRLSELKDSRSKWQTFQRFRTSLHGVEILTFDELLERASFIVTQQDESK